MKRTRSIRSDRLLHFKGFCNLLPVIGLALLAGCTTPLSEPQLSVETQAEALSHFSLGLLAENNGDSASALEHFEQAVKLDPDELSLYGPLIALAIKLDRQDTALHWADRLGKKYPDEKDSLLLRANVCTLTDRLPEAEILFKEITTRFADDPKTHLFLTRFYLSQENRPAALQTLEDAVELHPDHGELLQLLGMVHLDRARTATEKEDQQAALLQGADLLRRALESAPGSSEQWQQLGQALLLAEKPGKALEAFREAYTLQPDNILLARQFLYLTLQTRPVQDALKQCEELAEKTDTGMETWLQHLSENLNNEKQKELIEVLEEKVGQDPPPPAFYYARLSALYLTDKHNEQAKALLNKALILYPDESRLRIVMGYLALQEEQFETAYSLLEQVRQESPKAEWSNNPFFLYNFLVAAQKCDHILQAADVLAATHTNNPVVLNQYINALLTERIPVEIESAIELLDNFREQSPKTAEALYYLSLLQSEQKNYATALENARRFETEALQNNNTNLLTGFFYYQYGLLHERTGQREDAEIFFEKTIEVGGEALASSARNYIAYMWAERGEKLDKALVLVLEALESEPKNGAFIDTLGWVYYMKGRYAEALEVLQKALSLIDSDPAVWEHIGDTYFKLGDREAAIEHWKKALELSTDTEKLTERLESLGITLTDNPVPESGPADMPPRP